jgi:type VI secretion system protein ImpM
MTRSAGYHGKIPAQGDFIQRGLPLGFTRAWDRWLMEGIAGLKERRGEGWLDGYRTAPLWRFSVPAGAFGEAAMTGVLTASVDRVGRNFPLTIAVRSPDGCSPFAALLAQSQTLDRMAATARSAVSDGVKKDALDAAVDAIQSDAAEPPLIEEAGETLTVEGPNPEGAIAARWLERRYGPDAAVFLSDASGAERRLIATRSAPRPDLVARLFEGSGQPAPQPTPAEDDLDLLAPIEADVVAPVVAMTAAAEPTPATDDDIDALIGSEPLVAEEHTTPPAPSAAAVDLPPELDPDFDPAALPDPLDSGEAEEAHAPTPPTESRPATDEEIDALVGSDPLSGEETAPPPPPRRAESDDEDDPIAAILAGGGPES